MDKSEMYVGLLEGTVELKDILEGEVPEQFKKKKDDEGEEKPKKKKKNPFAKKDEDDDEE
jgi:hypothetical protein